MYEIWSLGHKPFEGYGNPEVRQVFLESLNPSTACVCVGAEASERWQKTDSTTWMPPTHLLSNDQLLVSIILTILHHSNGVLLQAS